MVLLCQCYLLLDLSPHQSHNHTIICAMASFLSFLTLVYFGVLLPFFMYQQMGIYTAVAHPIAAVLLIGPIYIAWRNDAEASYESQHHRKVAASKDTEHVVAK